jgi:hypothetical protein
LNPRTCLQLVPKFPPSVSGVGDYAYLLASELRKSCSWESSFLVFDHASSSSKNVDAGFPFTDVERSTSAMASHLDLWDGPIVLHYVGYGYHQRGCPVWLQYALRRWRAVGGNRVLITMFHELFASGPPWRSSFWTSPLQRRIAFGLASISDAAVSNSAKGVRYLSRMKKAIRIPVFSNVGELDCLPRWESRNKHMCIFGSGWYSSSEETHKRSLEQICKILEIDKVIWIGRPRSDVAITGIPIDRVGMLNASEVSEVMSNSKYAYLDYSRGYIGKSGVFAAFATHGMVVLSTKDQLTPDDGLFNREHGLTVAELELGVSDTELEQISANIWTWYNAHSIVKTSRAYGDLLDNLTKSSAAIECVRA